MRVANSCVRFHLRFLFFLFPDRSFPCRLDPIFRNLALRIPANRVNNKSLTYLGIVQCTEPGGLRIPMNSSKNREFWHMHRNYMCRNSGSLSEVSSLQLSEGEYQRSDRKTMAFQGCSPMDTFEIFTELSKEPDARRSTAVSWRRRCSACEGWLACNR
jgi:hypothetical protein